MNRQLLKDWYNACKKREGLNNADIALKCGLSRQALSDIINGDSVPSYYSGVKLAQFLGVSCDHLMSLLLCYGESRK